MEGRYIEPVVALDGQGINLSEPDIMKEQE